MNQNKISGNERRWVTLRMGYVRIEASRAGRRNRLDPNNIRDNRRCDGREDEGWLHKMQTMIAKRRNFTLLFLKICIYTKFFVSLRAI